MLYSRSLTKLINQKFVPFLRSIRVRYLIIQLLFRLRINATSAIRGRVSRYKICLEPVRMIRILNWNLLKHASNANTVHVHKKLVTLGKVRRLELKIPKIS